MTPYDAISSPSATALACEIRPCISAVPPIELIVAHPAREKGKIAATRRTVKPNERPCFFLTGTSVYYDTVMLDRIEKMIIQNIGQIMREIKQGHFQ
jgi:hypothetical protein